MSCRTCLATLMTTYLISIRDKVIYGWSPQEIQIGRTLRSIIEDKFNWVIQHDVMLLVYRRDRPVSWSRTEHTTEHKCAQDMALHTTELVLHTAGHICFDSLAVFTNRVFNLRIFAAVISFAQRVSHHHWKQCFDNDCSCDTFKCTKCACFGAESTLSHTAILSATCSVVCCAMLGCVQFGSVVWRVTRDMTFINISPLLNFISYKVTCIL